jgi:hypothetical protein
MKRSFNFTFNRRAKIHTVVTFIVVVIIAAILYRLYTGGFFSAWFISVVAALAALMILSIPRRIVLLDDRLEIQCVCDITEIEFREIASIRKVSRKDMRWVVRIFGSAGFFGYYGKFFDFKEVDIVTVYASEWDNFIEICDIYDSRTYVSCREADALINAIAQAKMVKEKPEHKLQQAI